MIFHGWRAPNSIIFCQSLRLSAPNLGNKHSSPESNILIHCEVHLLILSSKSIEIACLLVFAVVNKIWIFRENLEIPLQLPPMAKKKSDSETTSTSIFLECVIFNIFKLLGRKEGVQTLVKC